MIHFVNYAFGDKKYYDAQQIGIHEILRQVAPVTIWDLNEEYFKWSENGKRFYEENKFILDQKKGSWLWKPYFLDMVLDKADENDIIIYADVGDSLKTGFVNFIEKELEDKDYMLIQGYHLNKNHTSYECFDTMNCLDERYTEGRMLEAGIIGLRNTKDSRIFIGNWLRWCKNPSCIIDYGKKVNGISKNFSFHKCDQSVLTLLQSRNEIPTVDIIKILPFLDYNKHA